MIEFDTKYRTGRRAFAYTAMIYGWWLGAIGIGFAWLAYAIEFGILQAPTAEFLAQRPEWGMDAGMFAEWSALFAISFLFVGFLRTSVEYRKYSFYVDSRAFHLNRGLFRIQEITIPFKQISNVHIEQPYHWRLFGLAQLDITVASTRDTFMTTKNRDFLIPCIDKSLAKELSHFLVKEASGDEDESEDDDDEYDDEEDAEDIVIHGAR